MIHKILSSSWLSLARLKTQNFCSVLELTEAMENKCFHRQRLKGIFTKILGTTIGVVLCPELALGTPNGAWLSQPQIRFHSSTNTLPQVMADIQGQNYKVVFLDFRNVPDAVQQQTAQTARQQGLKPIVWIQSPQYRLLTVPMLIHEARHGDGMQVDDHFFANYSLEDFRTLRIQYSQPIFCSIQPFQSALVPKTGCNQLDLQCYTSNNFSNCEKLADRLKAVLSLSDKDTYKHKERLGDRSFNVFLWPYSHKYFGVSSKESLLGKTLRPFSFCGREPADAPLKWRNLFRHRVLVKRQSNIHFVNLPMLKLSEFCHHRL
jgi:hypothetical protein